MNRRHLITAGGAAALAAALSACTPYRPIAGGGTTYPSSGTTTAGVLADAVFTSLDRQIIRDYYRNSGLPPGLARRDSLPPGLQRQLVRNGRLPPGLEKRALPPDLRARLPSRDRRYDMVQVGTDVLLILIATGVILDIIENAAG
jgi:hypothetical protein